MTAGVVIYFLKITKCVVGSQRARRMVSSDHRSCGRSLSEGSSGSLSGHTGLATDGSVVDEYVFVRRRTLSGASSCRAVAAPHALQLLQCRHSSAGGGALQDPSSDKYAFVNDGSIRR